MLDEKRFLLNVTVAWLVSAKNALNTCYGYRPNQLVFGRNPNFPSNLTNNPPAMEDITCSELVSKHLCAMHEARIAFTELLVKHGGYFIRVHPCSLQLIHKGNSDCEGNESNSFGNYIDNTIEKKVDKNENIELESDDDIDFYPINNVPSNISNNDDIEDLTSSLNDLSIQSCNVEHA